MEMRIPEDMVTPEEFTAIRVRLRMLFGVPAEIIPPSYTDLFNDLNSDRELHPLHLWLLTHGYDVDRDYASDVFVITPDNLAATTRPEERLMLKGKFEL
jgi:hypothetical protein